MEVVEQQDAGDGPQPLLHRGAAAGPWGDPEGGLGVRVEEWRACFPGGIRKGGAGPGMGHRI